MAKALREFQVFVKPAGSKCNLGCDYCYYLGKEHLYPAHSSFKMNDEVLEAYIVQHIDAFPGTVINFSWHGGEPTLRGPDFFRRAVALQRRHRPPGRLITNGIQTNGTLLDDNWCRFLAEAGFGVGLSLDGPRELHDSWRVTKSRNPTHERAMRGYALLQRHRIPVDILCVVHAGNVRHPKRVYDFFKEIGAKYLTFLPLVEPREGAESGLSRRSVPPEEWGAFLCRIFDEWVCNDIGQVEVQIFDEIAGTACGRGHALCIFRETCGDIPVVEHNGDFLALPGKRRPRPLHRSM